MNEQEFKEVESRGVTAQEEQELKERYAKKVAEIEEKIRMKTAGVKFDYGKPPMHLLDSYAIEQLARVLEFGAKKYAEHNWRKGIAKTRLIAAALRHLFAYLRGEDTDPETGLSHAAHAMCCCMFLLGLEHRKDLDDRYKEE